MEVFSGHRKLDRALRAPALAIGNFDGVHAGHRRLLERARSAAALHGGEAVALTFDPPPARFLAPHLAPRLITTQVRKLELLAAAGIDVCVVEPFDRQLADLSPEAFARDVLAGALGARHIVVGYDFTFGKRRAGNTEILRQLGDQFGFTVEVVDPVAVEGVVASSSRVRSFVGDGNLAGARLLLGRDFEVDGVVVRGAGRGRALGVPTANLAPETELLPPLGIYAGWVEIAGDPARRPGAVSVGTNPTFEVAGKLSLEVFLLDWDGDLYGQGLRIGFVERLRGERRFPDADSLVQQIRRDIEDTRGVLSAAPPRR
jgi:riboflavin kinase/FMN adenylyltransferase